MPDSQDFLEIPRGLFEPPSPPGPPLAVVWQHEDNSEYVTRLSPRTLKERGRLDLGRRASRVTSFSPDGRKLMTVTWKGRVRIVDVERMSGETRFPLDLTPVTGVAWVEDSLAIATVGGSDGTEFVAFDPWTERIMNTEAVAGSPFAQDQTAHGVVALLHDTTPGQGPGATTIAVYDSADGLSTASLEEVRSGFYLPEGDELYTQLMPGLAVRGSLAVVVGTDGAIVTVDLDTLAVRMQGRGLSLFEKAAAWLVPPAHAKAVAGTKLEARWIGSGDLLVTGYRIGVTRETEYSTTEHPEPAGALVLDSDDWTARVIDEEATLARRAGDLLLVSRDLVPGDEPGDGIGVRAYDLDGRPAWETLGTSFAEVVSVHRGTALVRHGWRRVLISSIDLDTGEVLRTKPLTASFPPESGPAI